MHCLEDFRLRLGISAESAAARQLAAYLALLQKWNRHINLTGSAEWSRVGVLFEEAGWAAGLYPQDAATHLDIGSGAGFPAVVLRILVPRIRLDLIEGRLRRCMFLETVVQDLKLEGTRVLNVRLETFLEEEPGSWDCISWKGIRLSTRSLRALAERAGGATRFWMFHAREPAAEDPETVEKLLNLVRREACPARPGWWLSEYRKA